MFLALKGIWALFIGIGLFMLGNGLQGTLLGLRASMEDFGTAITGVVMSGYFIGLLAGSLITPVLIGRVGHIRVFAAFASVASTVFLLFAIFVDPVAWFVMRVLTGTCLAGLYVVAESWLNHAATNETRGKILSIYMIVAYAAYGLGQLLLNVANPGGFVLFILVSALVSLALVPVSLSNVSAPVVVAPRGVGITDIYRVSPLAVIACFVNGIGQGAFFGMGPVYASLLGLSFAEVSILMSLPILGVVLAQYPVGWLSDLFDRRAVLMVMAFLAAGAGAACVFAPDISFLALAVAFTAFGALALPLNSLAIAHANDHLDHDQMLGASAKLILIYGLGSSLGPMTVGAVMREGGPGGFFVYMIAVYAALGAFAVYRIVRRPAIPGVDRGDFVLMAPRATAVAAAAIAADWDDGSQPDDAAADPAGHGEPILKG